MIKKNFTKKNIINKVHQNLGFSKNISSTIVDDFFEIFSSEIIKTNKVKITSFGTFDVLNKKERIGRNPKTKVETKIQARKVVKFKASSTFKNKINK